jgi:hypothetical protein
MTSDEIKKAMREFSPVRYKGIEYKNINAYTYRIYRNPQTGKFKETFQLELQDKMANSVTIAEAEKVELIQ